jgi:catechol 2,3-dioxygenase-like lactoylglutathione lyase family enzyme
VIGKPVPALGPVFAWLLASASEPVIETLELPPTRTAFAAVLPVAAAVIALGDDVAIVRNEHGVELNLVFNANAGDPAANILMDVREKFPGYTHIALRVASIPAAIAALKANDIAITQGPVSFGEAGHVSVFIRDPDRNVIELRGRDQGQVEGVIRYVP